MLSNRLTISVRVTRTSIRDDPVDLGDIHSRDMDRGRLSSCIYTWLRARHPSRQDNRNKIDFYVSTISGDLVSCQAKSRTGPGGENCGPDRPVENARSLPVLHMYVVVLAKINHFVRS